MAAIWTPDRAVLEANLAFYDAFASHDVAAMDKVWANSHAVSCIHPGWQALHGRADVMASWRAILTGSEAPPIRCEDPMGQVYDQTAVVTCIERVMQTQLVATNVFVLERGLWKMVHHQAGQFVRRSFPSEQVPPKETLN